MAELLYFSYVTDIGAAKLTNAMLSGQMVDIIHFAVGDGAGTYYKPTPQQTALRREVWRGSITEEQELSPGLLAVSASIPSEVGGFTARELALYDAEGDLFAVANIADVEKVTLAQGMSSEIELTMQVAVINTEALQIKIDPSIVRASKKDIADHNAAADAHSQHTENMVAHITAEERVGWNGKAQLVVIPQGTDIPTEERKSGNLYLKVTDVQATLPDSIQVSPTMGIKVASENSRSGIDFT